MIKLVYCLRRLAQLSFKEFSDEDRFIDRSCSALFLVEEINLIGDMSAV